MKPVLLFFAIAAAGQLLAGAAQAAPSQGPKVTCTIDRIESAGVGSPQWAVLECTAGNAFTMFDVPLASLPKAARREGAQLAGPLRGELHLVKAGR